MLHYNEAGNGYPVVLLHGFCENNTCFNKQVLLLKGHYKVICPDLPGSGKSTPLVHATMESMADAVYELIEQLGIKKCVLIGHSMGGYVTMAFVKKYSHVLDGFGLLHSVATPDDDERKQKRVQAQQVIREKGPAFYARNFIGPLFREGSDAQLIKPYVDVADQFTAEGLISQLEAMKNRPDSQETLRQTPLPAFFGVGGYDTLIPSEKMIGQALMCEQSYIAILAESAHMGHIEQADLTASHLVQFVDGITAQ
jgi:pimeloyl-ACP methyl ester carboxylesterase